MTPEGWVDVGGVLVRQAADQLDGQSPHGGGLVVQGDKEGAEAVGLREGGGSSSLETEVRPGDGITAAMLEDQTASPPPRHSFHTCAM